MRIAPHCPLNGTRTASLHKAVRAVKVKARKVTGKAKKAKKRLTRR